jgi:DNA-binding response OmpR family regulator
MRQADGNPMRLLVVEDNADLAELLCSALDRNGFSTDVMASAANAEEALASSSYAAVILDLGLPDEDGLSLLRRLRRAGLILPILILTARGSVADRVDGLQAGADDYLTKPFAVEELVARLQALLRRPGELFGQRIDLGALSLDLQSRQILVAGRPETFSSREVDLLELLLRRAGRVVQKSYVEDHLFGLHTPVGSNAVEVAIHRLRKHLQTLQARVAVHTVKGVGYFIAEVKDGVAEKDGG